LIRRAFRLLVILGVAGILAGAVWFSLEYRGVRPGLPAGQFFEVKKGQGVAGIAAALEARGLIRSSLAFRLAYRLYYHPRSLKAGEYAFPGPVSPRDILSDMSRGAVYLQAVTVPEGLTGEETARELDRLGFVPLDEFMKAFDDSRRFAAWDPEAENAEGYLFPETYNFPRHPGAAEVMDRMISQFKTVFNDAWQRRAREMGLTVREVTTLASLIEKETSLPAEKRLVSAVFHNRLRLGMKLDCDPTIIYALKLAGDYRGRLGYRDLKLDSPYNTYLHRGLPPGPICNPGRESLEAALHPAAEGYLYFVSRNDGSHEFSRTLREHQLAVRRFQKRPAAARKPGRPTA
jgi:UPF0755 protein